MRDEPKLIPTLRRSRVGRVLVYVLILHVLALFSVLPFGQPAIAAPTPAYQVEAMADIQVGNGGAQAVVMVADGPDQAVKSAAPSSSIESVPGSYRVFGNRHHPDLDQIDPGMAQSTLFAGLRGCASLSPERARQVYLPPHRPYLLRAPPSAG